MLYTVLSGVFCFGSFLAVVLLSSQAKRFEAVTQSQYVQFLRDMKEALKEVPEKDSCSCGNTCTKS